MVLGELTSPSSLTCLLHSTRSAPLELFYTQSCFATVTQARSVGGRGERNVKRPLSHVTQHNCRLFKGRGITGRKLRERGNKQTGAIIDSICSNKGMHLVAKSRLCLCGEKAPQQHQGDGTEGATKDSDWTSSSLHKPLKIQAATRYGQLDSARQIYA